jgi:hypothetical protein
MDRPHFPRWIASALLIGTIGGLVLLSCFANDGTSRYVIERLIDWLSMGGLLVSALIVLVWGIYIFVIEAIWLVKRSTSFSVRDLFILTTVVAVMLGLGVLIFRQ